MRRLVVMIAAVSLSFAAAFAGGMTSPAAPASPQFERLKALAGTWTGTATHGGGPPMEATVTYRVIAAGSTVIETLFPGTPHEMVSVYHTDGADLVMTHYCAAGNQPHMKAAPGAADGPLVFAFVSGSNMKPADEHMHGVEFTFIDADHVRAVWTSQKDGQPAGRASFDLTRKKS